MSFKEQGFAVAIQPNLDLISVIDRFGNGST
jgi:hypothetical protein